MIQRWSVFVIMARKQKIYLVRSLNSVTKRCNKIFVKKTSLFLLWILSSFILSFSKHAHSVRGLLDTTALAPPSSICCSFSPFSSSSDKDSILDRLRYFPKVFTWKSLHSIFTCYKPSIVGIFWGFDKKAFCTLCWLPQTKFPLRP